MKDYAIIVMPTWLVIVCCGTIIAQAVMTIISEELKKKREARAAIGEKEKT